MLQENQLPDKSCTRNFMENTIGYPGSGTQRSSPAEQNYTNHPYCGADTRRGRVRKTRLPGKRIRRGSNDPINVLKKRRWLFYPAAEGKHGTKQDQCSHNGNN
jgi:hypothetical protein